MLYVVSCGSTVAILSYNFYKLFLPIRVTIFLYFYLYPLTILASDLLSYCLSDFCTILFSKHCTLLVSFAISNSKR